MSKAVLVLAACLGLAACHKPAPAPPSPPPVCSRRLAEHLRHTEPDALAPDIWFELLFKGYQAGQPLRDPVDCLGDPIEWDTLPSDCREPEPAARDLPMRPLGPNDLVIRNASGNYWFGWAPYRRLESGMAEGPLAIARTHAGRLEFRAVGTLRAYPNRARFEVRQIGEAHVLVAEGEHCVREGTSCQRALRLMWLDRQRFRVRPLRAAATRTCLGPAWFPVTQEILRTLDGDWQRTLRRDLAIAFEGNQITVDEAVSVFDRDLRQPTLPPRVFREAQAKLWIAVRGGELATQGQSIWPSIQIEDARTEREGRP